MVNMHFDLAKSNLEAFTRKNHTQILGLLDALDAR